MCKAEFFPWLHKVQDEARIHFFSFEFDLKKELSNKAFKDFMGTCCRIVFLSFFLSGSLGQDGSRKDGKSLVMQKIRILCSLMFS